MKMCRACRVEKPLTEFHKSAAYKSGYQARCKICLRQDRRGTFARYMAKVNADPTLREAHIRRVRAHGKKTYHRHKEKFKLLQQKQNAALREEMFSVYGRHCECCWESRKQFLTLEHKNGDGGEHRRRLNGRVIQDLKRRGWPRDGFTILCMNCNWAKRFGGACPHEGEPYMNAFVRRRSMRLVQA